MWRFEIVLYTGIFRNSTVARIQFNLRQVDFIAPEFDFLRAGIWFVCAEAHCMYLIYDFKFSKFTSIILLLSLVSKISKNWIIFFFFLLDEFAFA